MDNTERINFLIATGKVAMEMGEADDLAPTLVVEGPVQTTVLVLAGAHPFVMLQAAVDTVREMHPVCVSFTSDTYIVKGSVDDIDDVEAMRVRHGYSLQRAFEAGEKSVFEALAITIVTSDIVTAVTVPYTRFSTGIEWHEPTMSNASDGRIINVLREMVTS